MSVPLPVAPFLRAVRETREHAAGPSGVLVRGAMAAELARALATGGDASAVRAGGEPREDTAALVLVLAGPTSGVEVELLRRAARTGLAAAVVRLRPEAGDPPYVLATDVLDAGPGEGFPLDALARVLARRLGGRVVPLAAALPALRGAASAQLARDAALRNALLAGVPWGPALAMPLLRRNQLGLVLDVVAANGREVGPQRAPEAAAVAVAALGLRAAGRRVGRRLPFGRLPARAALAYSATLAIGFAATLRSRLPA